MRLLGVDFGRRRVGLAISDPTQTLARPLETLVLAPGEDAAVRVAARVGELCLEDDGLTGIVVGVPRRLNGTESDQTPAVLEFVRALKAELKRQAEAHQARKEGAAGDTIYLRPDPLLYDYFIQ